MAKEKDLLTPLYKEKKITREGLQYMTGLRSRCMRNIRRFEKSHGAPPNWKYIFRSYNGARKRLDGLSIDELVDIFEEEGILTIFVSYKGSKFACSRGFIELHGEDHVQNLCDQISKDPDYLSNV